MTIYTSQNDTFQASIHHYPVDGFELEISQWDSSNFKIMFNKRMVGYTVYEAVTGALGEIGLSWDEAEQIADEMGLEPHFDEDEEDEGEA